MVKTIQTLLISRSPLTFELSENILHSKKLSTKQYLIAVLFDLGIYLEDCQKMSSIPQGAFAVCKLREMDDKQIKIARMQFGGESSELKKSLGNEKLEYGADKYHEKLMNSIWGLYNRYSPHNIKRNEYVKTEQGYYLHQHDYAAASNAIAENLVMALRSGRC